MLKLSDLALRPDLQIGSMLVSPSRRLVEGPGGHAHLEPLIMQVFLLLLDAGGKVVTRTELFDQCWGGVIVGDDSLNRAIAKVRRTGAQISPGFFEIETIPRTGYRLTGEILRHVDGGPERSTSRGMSRRRLVSGGAAIAATAAAGGWWLWERPRSDPEFDRLLAQAESSLRTGNNMDEPKRIALLERLVQMNPNSAKAWGLLAYARSLDADEVSSDRSGKAVSDTEAAAARAFAIDPDEPNAILAVAFVQSRMSGWTPLDTQLRRVRSIDPANTSALQFLVALTQAAGLTRESWKLNEQARVLQPLDATHIFRKALKLWILDRVPESYRVIDRAFDLWPRDRGVWNARFYIFAFTHREQAARAMLNDGSQMLGSPDATPMWRAALAALEDPSAGNVLKARESCLARAVSAPGLAAHAVMILGALEQTDAAFAVANGFLLSRGPIVMRSPEGSRAGWVKDAGWKWTQWLFTPTTASLRADSARFADLCDGIGLTDYWRARNVKPDYQVYL